MLGLEGWEVVCAHAMHFLHKDSQRLCDILSEMLRLQTSLALAEEPQFVLFSDFFSFLFTLSDFCSLSFLTKDRPVLFRQPLVSGMLPQGPHTGWGDQGKCL